MLCNTIQLKLNYYKIILCSCIASVVAKDKDLCWKIPDTWTFEEAVTVPVVYNLIHLRKIEKMP